MSGHSSSRSFYLSIQQLSEQSSLSITQLRRLVKQRKIPFLQPGGKGGKLLFPLDAIERAGSGAEESEPQSTKPLSGRRPSWMDDDQLK